ncbi:MAG: type II toxin-antitoxin system VapC family toxin [Anaerolineales bacterium]|nr:type II toxin-antitoxin system VapC family toxin [Anaerolineales bacterium]
MDPRVFLDTAVVVALASPADKYHEKARRLSRQIEREGISLVTTRAILIEIGDALSEARWRNAASVILRALEDDQNLAIVQNSEELYRNALALYVSRPDKEWGMTDCISFVVMESENIVQALTTDTHFQQAGFIALLRE